MKTKRAKSKPETIDTTKSRPSVGCNALVRRCERTISETGWYWFVPKFQKIAGRPKFVLVDDDAIEGGHMNRKMYAGEYIGPMNIGAIEATPNAKDQMAASQQPTPRDK